MLMIYKKINKFTAANTKFSKVKKVDTLKYYRNYKFKDSKFTELNSRWSGFVGRLKTGKNRKYIPIRDDSNVELAHFCHGLIPSILYFPNFLFDFPSKIFLEAKEEQTPK